MISIQREATMNGYIVSNQATYKMDQSNGRTDLTKLNKYYDETVAMSRKSTQTSVKTVMPIIAKILAYVNKQDPRFLKEMLCLGSYYQHLKVNQADEFDYSVLIDTGNMVWGSRTVKYYEWDKNVQKMARTTVPLPTPPTGYTPMSHGTFDNKYHGPKPAPLTFDGDIIPILVKRRFRDLVTEAIRELDFKGQIRPSKLGETPATKLTITVPCLPFDIDVDLCPMAPSKLEFLPKMNWPRTDKMWPSKEKVKDIKAIGVNMVTKTDLFWRFSFALCERELLQEIDKDGGCRKKSQRIMKKLREDVWCPKGMKQELTSFHLKNMLFWECEDHPHTREWDQDNLAIRIESMTGRLLGHLRDKRLPMYFYRDVDLLANKDSDVIDEIADRIDKFLKDPNLYLNKFM